MQYVKMFVQKCPGEMPIDRQITNFLAQNWREKLQNVSLSVSPNGEQIALAIFEYSPLTAASF